MLGLPKQTERKEQIAKSLIFKTLTLKHGDRTVIDNTFRRLDVVNVLHPKTLNVKEGKTVKSIYILRAELSGQSYTKDDIMLLPKYIKQHLILVLICDGQIRLAVRHKDNFFQWPYWQTEETAKLELQGMTLEGIWESFVSQIGNLGAGNEDLEIKLKVQQLESKLKKLQGQIAKAKNKAPLFAEYKRVEKELKGFLELRT